MSKILEEIKEDLAASEKWARSAEQKARKAGDNKGAAEIKKLADHAKETHGTFVEKSEPGKPE